MKIAFLPAAQVELDDTFLWYEEQAIGLGYEFLDEIDQSLRLVANYPELQPRIDNNIRRCLTNRFPYGIFYGVAEGNVIVVAVGHLKRKPIYWKNRLKK